MTTLHFNGYGIRPESTKHLGAVQEVARLKPVRYEGEDVVVEFRIMGEKDVQRFEPLTVNEYAAFHRYPGEVPYQEVTLCFSPEGFKYMAHEYRSGYNYADLSQREMDLISVLINKSGLPKKAHDFIEKSLQKTAELTGLIYKKPTHSPIKAMGKSDFLSW